MSNGNIEIYNSQTKQRIYNDKILNSFYNNSFVNPLTKINVFELSNSNNEYKMNIITTNEKNQRMYNNIFLYFYRLYILHIKMDNYNCQISFMNAIDKVINSTIQRTNENEENENEIEEEEEDKSNDNIHNIYTLNNYIYNKNDGNLYILWNYRDSEKSSDCLTCFDTSKNIHYEIVYIYNYIIIYLLLIIIIIILYLFFRIY